MCNKTRIVCLLPAERGVTVFVETSCEVRPAHMHLTTVAEVAVCQAAARFSNIYQRQARIHMMYHRMKTGDSGGLVVAEVLYK